MDQGLAEARPRGQAVRPVQPRSRGAEHPSERHGALAVRGCGRRDVGRHPERGRPRHPEAAAVRQLHTQRREPEQPGGRHDLVRARRPARHPVDRDGDAASIGSIGGRTGSPSTSTIRANPHSLSYDKVSGMREDRIGRTVGGHVRRRTSTASIPRPEDSFTIVTIPKDPRSLDKDLVLSVFLDRKDVLWVGTQEGALNRFDRSSGRFKAYRSPAAQTTSTRYSRTGRESCGLGAMAVSAAFDPRTEQFTVHAPRRARSPQHQQRRSVGRA